MIQNNFTNYKITFFHTKCIVSNDMIKSRYLIFKQSFYPYLYSLHNKMHISPRKFKWKWFFKIPLRFTVRKKSEYSVHLLDFYFDKIKWKNKRIKLNISFKKNPRQFFLLRLTWKFIHLFIYFPLYWPLFNYYAVVKIKGKLEKKAQ